MKLDPAQRLMLVMLADISKKLEIDDGISPSVIERAIASDNTWALDWEYSGVLGYEADPTPRHVRQTSNILDMWHLLEISYKKLSNDEKRQLEESVGVFGKDVEFSGFDGNNETEHFGAAGLMIDTLGRFQHFKGRDLNSHCPTVASNLRALSVFDEIRASVFNRTLTHHEMTRILKAYAHPDANDE